MAAEVDAEAEPGRSRVGLHLKLSDLLDAKGLHHDDVAVTRVAGRRCAADEAGQARVVGDMERFGRQVLAGTGFEPVTSSVSGMAIPSDTAGQHRVTAARRGSAVVARCASAGDAWRRCHSVRHCLAGSLRMRSAEAPAGPARAS